MRNATLWSVTVVWMGWRRPMGRRAKWATSSRRSYTCPLSAFKDEAGGGREGLKLGCPSPVMRN